VTIFKNNLKNGKMKEVKSIIAIIGIFILLFSSGSKPVYNEIQAGLQPQQTTSQSQQTSTKSQQTNTKSQQTSTKSQQTSTKSKQTSTKTQQTSSKTVQSRNSTDPGTVRIGSQIWAVANLNVGTFRNGDTIPEAKTNEEWKAAGDARKPAWCYYNNDPANGQKFGKLYNWYAVNDPRGLAPKGWTLPADADWMQLSSFLGGQEAAGTKIKSTSGWQDGNNGENETGFNGLPAGYRVENGTFMNIWNNAIWWTTTENNSISAFDYYLVLRNSLNRSNSPKQRGSSVRCLKEK
jgi:uncharacterized protein (TIGR02145 family)